MSYDVNRTLIFVLSKLKEQEKTIKELHDLIWEHKLDNDIKYMAFMENEKKKSAERQRLNDAIDIDELFRKIENSEDY